ASSITVLDVSTGKKKKQLPVPGTPSLGNEVSGLVFSADGKSLTGQTIMGLSTWDVETGKMTSARARALESPYQQVRSPDGLLALEEWSRGWELIEMQSMTGSGILPGSRFPLTQSLMLRDAASGVALLRLEEKTTLAYGRDRRWDMPEHGLDQLG